MVMVDMVYGCLWFVADMVYVCWVLRLLLLTIVRVYACPGLLLLWFMFCYGLLLFGLMAVIVYDVRVLLGWLGSWLLEFIWLVWLRAAMVYCCSCLLVLWFRVGMVYGCSCLGLLCLLLLLFIVFMVYVVLDCGC